MAAASKITIHSPELGEYVFNIDLTAECPTCQGQATIDPSSNGNASICCKGKACGKVTATDKPYDWLISSILRKCN